ncbi:MAG: Smr/MutS family protein [Spirochaetia bacterium]|nr:Smr/MutS family protein [Spirochaetia bacterium]
MSAGTEAAMDFGEVMREWEKISEKAKANGKLPGSQGFQEAWMDTEAARSADPHEGRSGQDRGPGAYLSRRDIDRLPVDATLDLHGMTGTEAEAALGAFFERAEADGLRKVLIVHGKGLHSRGQPVLGTVVARWLEARPSAGRTGTAGRSQGGSGAVWVLLKEGDQRSR